LVSADPQIILFKRKNKGDKQVETNKGKVDKLNKIRILSDEDLKKLKEKEKIGTTQSSQG
jgi:hypothetical protein